MTVNTAPSVKRYTGNAVTTAFSTVFQFRGQGDINVYLDGVLKTITTHYTVSGGDGSTGTVTFLSAPAIDAAIILQRLVDFKQDTDFADFDGNPAATTEAQFDLIVMQTQQLSELGDRALTLALGSTGISAALPMPSARKALVWNDAEDAIENSSSNISDIADALTEAEENAATAVAAAATAVAAAATAVANAIKIPSTIATDTGKLMVVNAAGTAFQLLSNGNSGNILISAGSDSLPSFQSITVILSILNPVGTLYFNKTDSTNPATLFGFGTWVAVADKFIVTRGSTYTATGGAATVIISEANLDPHEHFMFAPGNAGSNGDSNDHVTNSQQISGVAVTGGNTTNYNMTGTATAATLGKTSTTGSAAPLDIIPPYQAAYCWERTV